MHTELFRKTILFCLGRKDRREASSQRFRQKFFYYLILRCFFCSCLLIYELLDSNNGGDSIIKKRRKNPDIIHSLSFVRSFDVLVNLKLIILFIFCSSRLEKTQTHFTMRRRGRQNSYDRLSSSLVRLKKKKNL